MSEVKRRPLWVFGIVPLIATLIGLWAAFDVNAPFSNWAFSDGLIIVGLVWLGCGILAYADSMSVDRMKKARAGVTC